MAGRVIAGDRIGERIGRPPVAGRRRRQPRAEGADVAQVLARGALGQRLAREPHFELPERPRELRPVRHRAANLFVAAAEAYEHPRAARFAAVRGFRTATKPC